MRRRQHKKINLIEINRGCCERLCEEDENMTIQTALRKAIIIETKHANKSSDVAGSSVNFVKKNMWSQNRGKVSGGNNSGSSSDVGRCKSNYEKRQNIPCSHCGWRNHSSQSCKFKESKCHSCGRIGHLASVCRNKTSKGVNYVSKNEVTSNDLFNYYIFSVADRFSSDVYSLSVKIDGVELKAVCDTGAPYTLIPVSFFNTNNFNKTLRQCSVPYVDYSGDRISVVGEYDASVTYQSVNKSVVVVVSNSKTPPLLGRSFLRAFNFQLFQVNNVGTIDKNTIIIDQLKNEFADVFDSQLGKYEINQISLRIDDDAKPIFCKPRPLPLAWKDKIEKQLRELIRKDVLEPVDNSDWGTPLVSILKPNGDLRICGDYKVTINKFLVDFKYPLPRIDEIFASLRGGTIFTNLDLSNAYN